MKLPINKKHITYILILCWHCLQSQTQVVNNGALITGTVGSKIYIDGHYINQNDGTLDGTVQLDGQMYVNYNWINNAFNNVFINTGVGTPGEVILNGTLTIQSIEGLGQPTYFENLTLNNSNKILNQTDCRILNSIKINAVLDLNAKRIIITNPLPSALIYQSKKIISETNPTTGYGVIQWNIGDKTDTYQIPFGTLTSNTNNLNLIFSTKTQGQPSTGTVSFSTYPTDGLNNPVPIGTVPLSYGPEEIVDRYWVIDADYTLKPAADIVFRYSNEDVDIYDNYNLDPGKLKAVRYNPLSGLWDDWGPRGIPDEITQTVTLTAQAPYAFGVPGNELHKNWTLVAAVPPVADILIPSAFTPNGDSKNDIFIPVFHPDFVVETYSFTIYDRWGKVVFSTTNASEGWNGLFIDSDEPAPIGVYTWQVKAKGIGKSSKLYTGRVTLLK